MGEDRGPILIANVLVFGIITFWVVVLRIGFRIHRKSTNASDWFLGIALISSICQEVFNAACVTEWGYGQHATDLPPHSTYSPVPLKLIYLNRILSNPTTLFTKLSLCYTYTLLFRPPRTTLTRISRLVNTLTATLILIHYTAAFLVCIFLCAPVSKTWRPREPGKCIDLARFRYATGAMDIATSVLVMATPLPVLFRARQTRREGAEVVGLLVLGAVYTGCTTVRLILTLHPAPNTKSDPQCTSPPPSPSLHTQLTAPPTGSSVPASTLAVIETDIGIIAASLVVMRPFFHALYHAVTLLWPYRPFAVGRAESALMRRAVGAEGGIKVVRTVEVELDCVSVGSEEEMLGTRSWGTGGR